MPNYVSLTESQRRKIAVFITESQQQAQSLQQHQPQANSNGDDSVILSGSNNAAVPVTGANSISCKEIVQFCKTRFGLTISLSTASRLRSSATERLATELLNPLAKRHRSVKFPEFEKALVQELKALEQEQIQIQQEQERQNPGSSLAALGDQAQLPPVMTLTSEAAITQVAKGIAERMGIPPAELGLTSGWYHGFKRRHGIKHRQFKSRSGANNSGTTTPGGLGGPTLGSIGSTNLIETGDGSDGADGGDGGDGDEEMEDAQDSNDTNDTGLPGEGSSSDAGMSSATPLYLRDQLSISNIVLTPKEPPASSLRRRPEVKKVTAATANDALDVISEYLLQNGQIGATKLPLVKELRKFLLAQTEAENGTANNNNLLLGVGVPSLAPGPANPDNAPVFVNNSTTISTLANPVLAGVNPISLSTSGTIGGPGMIPVLETNQSSLTLPANGLTTMREVLNSHQHAQQQVQHQHQELQPHQYQQSNQQGLQEQQPSQ
ncbi:hypothetical protein BGX21_008177 [Mortierella sp. AD011]|nr:hypothetical protein BGX20_008217 [Mortierella sp. AD010]KAF9398083.1 hypothetical protein BGX21_008177 [Mortierella sp. AD011]